MNKTFIIAEAGVNHNGSLFLAKRIIDKAKKAGADAVKFQTYIVEDLCDNHVLTAPYQSKKKKLQNKLLEKLSFKLEKYNILKKYCKLKKIIFLSSAFDIKSLKFLIKLKLKYYKIPSGQINDFPYLKELAKHNKKILLSTGMSTVKEVANAVNFLIKFGTKKKNITVLHCNSAYPTPNKDLNLKAIPFLKKKIGVEVGFSDHSKGIIASMIAVSYGARFIEKHLTINKSMIGPDHKASLNPKEFIQMVKNIRVVECIMGENKKKVTASEKMNINYVRKSIISCDEIIKGEKFTKKNITTKRPGYGISPDQYFNLIGKKSKNNYKYNQIINIKELL